MERDRARLRDVGAEALLEQRLDRRRPDGRAELGEQLAVRGEQVRVAREVVRVEAVGVAQEERPDLLDVLEPLQAGGELLDVGGTRVPPRRQA